MKAEAINRMLEEKNATTRLQEVPRTGKPVGEFRYNEMGKKFYFSVYYKTPFASTRIKESKDGYKTLEEAEEAVQEYIIRDRVYLERSCGYQGA